MKALINKIIPFSNVDGPGNRCAIFFQKCPFSCLYCHNPETIHTCINCGDCVKTCPTQALTIKNGKVSWNEVKCVNCDTCIHTCIHMSSPKTKMMSVKEVMKEILPYFPYIEGITVSGGECMENAPFLFELFTAVKKEKKTCLIDSNGFYSFKDYPKLMKVCDGVMLDVKAFDLKFHRFLTGQSNEMVLDNLRYLQENNRLYEVRTVCLPNKTKENKETVTKVAKILHSDIRYKLIKYRPFGVRNEGLKELGNMITSDSSIKGLEALAKQNGCQNVIIV